MPNYGVGDEAARSFARVSRDVKDNAAAMNLYAEHNDGALKIPYFQGEYDSLGATGLQGHACSSLVIEWLRWLGEGQDAKAISTWLYDAQSKERLERLKEIQPTKSNGRRM